MSIVTLHVLIEIVVDLVVTAVAWLGGLSFLFLIGGGMLASLCPDRTDESSQPRSTKTAELSCGNAPAVGEWTPSKNDSLVEHAFGSHNVYRRAAAARVRRLSSQFTQSMKEQLMLGKCSGAA